MDFNHADQVQNNTFKFVGPYVYDVIMLKLNWTD